MEWNEEQTAVLHYPGKYLRIYGGPAAGKSLLISALANEYSKREKGGVYILCRSRDETDRMTQRMYRLAGNTPVNIETFRSFADRIAGGLRAIITPFQERLILTDILSAIPEGHYLYPAGKSYQLSEELADFLRIIRLNYITPDILPSQGDELTIGLKRIYTELEDKIRTANLMTEPQLMKFAADHAPDDVKAILVDEAQDLELPAYEFIRKIGGRGASIVLAGDLYQNIHRYQGADPDFLREKFPIDFPLARTIHLKRSYRAGSLRISTANKMFGSGFEQFRPEPHNGNEELYLHDFHDPQHEALGIAGLIEMLIRRNGYAPEDIAVILRSPRRGSAGLRRALQLRNIQVNGGEAPFLTPSAWDLIKSASACDNSEDILLKLPSFLSDIIEKHHSSEIMLEPLSGLRKLFEEAAAVMPHWKSYKIAAAVKEEFLRQPFRREKGGVSIMSVHQAKGRDFKAVFMPALVERTFPAEVRGEYLFKADWIDNLRKKLPVPLTYLERADLEKHLREERRLFYTAFTLASEKTYLSRYTHDESGEVNPSLFLHEIGALSEDSPEGFKKNSPIPSGIFAVEKKLDIDARKLFLRLDEGKRRDFTARLSKNHSERLDIDFITAPQPPASNAGQSPPIIDHLSASALNDYLHCPRRYYYSHVLKIPYPETPAMTAGKIVHKVLENLHKAGGHLDSEEALNRIEDITNEAVSGMKLSETNTVDFTKLREYIISLLRNYLADSECYGREVMKTEWKFEWRPVEELKIEGKIDRIDIIDGGLEIIDYKISGKQKHQALFTRFSDFTNKDADIQLPLYYAAAMDLFNLPVKYISLLPISFKKGPPQRIRFEIIDSEIKISKGKLCINDLLDIRGGIIDLSREILSCKDFTRGINSKCRDQYADIICPYIMICDAAE